MAWRSCSSATGSARWSSRAWSVRGPGDAAYRRVLAEQGRQTTIVAAGDQLWLDGIELDVDWPPPGTVPARATDDGKQVNDESIVMDLRYGDAAHALHRRHGGGDRPAADRARLASTLVVRSTCSRSPTTARARRRRTRCSMFFSRRVAVISVGADNNYGHPAPRRSAPPRARRDGLPNGPRRFGRDQHRRTRPCRQHRTTSAMPDPSSDAPASERWRIGSRIGHAANLQSPACPSLPEPKPPPSCAACTRTRSCCRHSIAVAEVAAFLADAMVRRGVAVDAARRGSGRAAARPGQDAAR